VIVSKFVSRTIDFVSRTSVALRETNMSLQVSGLLRMEPAAGLEPATPCLQGSRGNIRLVPEST